MAGDRVVVGSIARAHGVRGRVLVRPLSDEPLLRFSAGSQYLTDRGVRLTVRAVSGHPSGLIVEFTEVADRGAAEALAGSSLTIDAAERRQLADGEYWPDELIGCTVVDPSGATIGAIVGYEFGAAQDRLLVEAADGSRAQVPFVDELVPEVDVGRRVVVCDLPEGLFEPG